MSDSDSEADSCMICNEAVPLNCDRDYSCFCEGIYCSLCFFRKCILFDEDEIFCCYNCLPSELEDMRDEYLKKKNKGVDYMDKIVEINKLLDLLKSSEEPDNLKVLLNKDDLLHLYE